MKLTLKELLEQKALLQKHLSWIEDKIREAGGDESTTDSQETFTSAEVIGQPQQTQELVEPELEPAEEVEVDISQYQGAPLTTADDARRSCLYIMIGSFVLFCLFILIAYTLWPDDKPEKDENDEEVKEVLDPTNFSFSNPSAEE